MSKKRPAPGSSPQDTMQQRDAFANTTGIGDTSQMTDEQFIAWSSGQDATNNQNMYGTQSYPVQTDGRFGRGSGSDQMGNQLFSSSNELVRRNPNQQLSRTGEFFSNQDIATIGDNGLDNASDESDGELDRKAAAAKREAQSKRPPKQIPPFIQKLSSFLDDTRNEDLIRWSDDGKTFIVLDEETFANTLIPELFKHKNFASFVRQLNMYGFHKVLGLADNSMRASEKKSKNPSQYRHKYFRRGRPELLWMVTKPKPESQGPKKKKRKVGDDQESDDDAEPKDEVETSHPATKASTRAPGAVTLPHSQWTAIQSELAQLKQSQQHINRMIARFQHQNDQYVRQATAQHERHENSINAILTFLATFYNRSLENNDVSNMFGNAIPQAQPRRDVEDVGDVEESPGPQKTQFPPFRRPQLLLGPPGSPARQTQSGQSRATSSPPRSASATQQGQSFLQPQQAAGYDNSRPQSNRSSVQSSPAEAIFDNFSETNLPQRQRQPQQQGQTSAPSPTNSSDMMSMIHRANQNTNSSSETPNIDFSSALRHFENSNGNNPLTAEERNNMLSLMANTSGTSSPAINSGNNALFNPNAINTSASATADYNQYLSNREHIAALQRLQQEQHDKVQSLAGRLSPLSPSGSIPGLAITSGDPSGGDDLYGNSSFGAPGDFDLNNYIDYFPELDADVKNNFGNDGANNLGVDFPDSTTNFDMNQNGDQDVMAGADGDAKIAQPSSTGAAEREPNALANEDHSIFGSSNPGTPPNNGAPGPTSAANAGEAGEAGSLRGRVLGSVGSSSGVQSPSVEEADDDEMDGSSQQRQQQQQRAQRRSQRLRKG